jgi:hypothetical protein
MAKYEHLPIYKKAFDTVVYFEQIVRHFSRYHKYTLGTDLRNTSREIVKLIVKANNARNKKPYLLAIRENLEDLKLLIRVSKEVRAFNNFNSFQHAIQLTVETSKQNEGWLKSQK